MPQVMTTVHLMKPIKDLEAQEVAQEKYKKSQSKRIETEKKQAQSTVLQVPVTQKLIAERRRQE